MAYKDPKTFRGEFRKQMSGDGRKNFDTSLRETLFGKKGKGKRSKKED